MVTAFRSTLCAAILLAAPTAAGQSVAPVDSTTEFEAKRAFEDGLRLLREGQWVESESRFRQSLAVIPRPSASYDLAFVLFKQGRARESAELLQHLLASAESSPDSPYREYAKLLLPNVLAQLSTLRIVVDPPGSDLRIDGKLVPLTGAERSVPLDPGAHAVEVASPGFLPDRFDVVMEAHGEIERSISLQASTSATGMVSIPRPAAAPKLLEPTRAAPVWSAVAPWLTMGLGGALLAGAAVTGILAKREDDSVREACPTLRNCDLSLVPARDRAVELGHITDALLVSGGALVAGGVTWRILVSAPGRADSRSAFVAAGGVF